MLELSERFLTAPESMPRQANPVRSDQQKEFIMPTLKPNGKRLNGKGSGWVSSTYRLAIYLRDNLRCIYCHKDFRTLLPHQRTLDHVIPRKLGGTNHLHNLVAACTKCNSTRQGRTLRDFVLSMYDTEKKGMLEYKKILYQRRKCMGRYLIEACLAICVAGKIATYIKEYKS